MTSPEIKSLITLPWQLTQEPIIGELKSVIIKRNPGDMKGIFARLYHNYP